MTTAPTMTPQAPWYGVANLNKPIGPTSRDCLNVVQRLVRPARVGHAGTLDPLASGVLVIALGPATRLISYIQQQPKQYRARFVFGQESDSLDSEGPIRLRPDDPHPDRSQVEAALAQWTGEILQRPPEYSAIKVGGRRAYELARRGEAVELSPRPVRIDRLEILGYEYPTLELLIDCGSGTYVRSLGRDIATTCGTAAVMTELVRTAIGPFRLEDSVDPSGLTLETLQPAIQPACLAVAQLPSVELTPEEVRSLRFGRLIRREGITGEELAAVDSHGQLLAVMSRVDDGLWKPARNLVQG